MEKRGGGGKKMDEGQSRGSVQEEALSWGPVLLRLGGPGNRPWLANTGPASGSLGCLETPLHSRKPTQEIPASPEGTPPPNWYSCLLGSSGGHRQMQLSQRPCQPRLDPKPGAQVQGTQNEGQIGQ